MIKKWIAFLQKMDNSPMDVGAPIVFFIITALIWGTIANLFTDSAILIVLVAALAGASMGTGRNRFYSLDLFAARWVVVFAGLTTLIVAFITGVRYAPGYSILEGASNFKGPMAIVLVLSVVLWLFLYNRRLKPGLTK